MSNLVRSPLNHIGNKFRILPELLDIIPSPEVCNDYFFIDVFGGSFNVGINSGFKNIIFNEKDKELFNIINFFIKNEFKHIDNLIKEKVNKYSLITQKDYKKNNIGYKKLRDDYNHYNRDIVSLIVLVFFSFNSEIRFNSKGQFNVPIGKSGYSNYRRKNLELFSQLAKDRNIKLYNEDFEDFVLKIIKKLDPEKIIFYFDPPYLVSQAPYNSTWSITDENRLISIFKILDDKGIKFVASNFLKNGNNINTVLKKFIEDRSINVKKINISYKNSNYHRKNKEVEEIIFWNYE